MEDARVRQAPADPEIVYLAPNVRTNDEDQRSFSRKSFIKRRSKKKNRRRYEEASDYVSYENRPKQV